MDGISFRSNTGSWWSSRKSEGAYIAASYHLAVDSVDPLVGGVMHHIDIPLVGVGSQNGQMTSSEQYTGVMKHRVVSVTEFKAKCLALLDDIGERGGTITITRRGRPLATVEPARRPAWKSPEGSWTKKVTFVQDLLDVDTSRLWEVLEEDPEVRN